MRHRNVSEASQIATFSNSVLEPFLWIGFKNREIEISGFRLDVSFPPSGTFSISIGIKQI